MSAFVKIPDGKDHAGEEAVYRFTIYYYEGKSMRTKLPVDVAYTGIAAAQVDICRAYYFSYTEPLTNCYFDSSTNMVSFDMPDSTNEGYFTYELGNLKNPSYSQMLSGFLIQTMDANGTALYQSNEFMVQV